MLQAPAMTTALLLAAVGTVDATVTCRLTIDNILTGVWYNGAPLVIGGGDATDWTKVKTISFIEAGAGGGVLEITGREASGCGQGCSTSGLLMRCTGGTYWDGYTTNANPELTRTYGSCRQFNAATLTQSRLTPPCISTSGFNMPAIGEAVKVWPANGGAYAYFWLAASTGAPSACTTTPGTTILASCATLEGLVYNPFGQYMVAPINEGTHGFCSPNGTATNGADTVCGTATFTLTCSSPTSIQAVATGQAASAQGNDDSFYSYVDGQRSLARTVHTGYRVGSWRPSVPIFAHAIPLTAGTHNITLAEREDGTRVQSLTLTQGQDVCHFTAPPPRCTGLPNVTAYAGCAKNNGFTYYNDPRPGYITSPTSPNATRVSGGAYCNSQGVMHNTTGTGASSGTTSGDSVCGTATFTLSCSQATTIQASITARATLQVGGDDSFWIFMDDNRQNAQRLNTGSGQTWHGVPNIFTTAMSVTAGNHTLTFAEREDGTQLQSVTLTQGQGTCQFIQPTPLGLARQPPTPAFTSASLVTCKMTIDNIVASVMYNNQPLNVQGDLTDWTVVKTFAFYEDGPDGGALTIAGSEASGCGKGCSQSGLLMTCSGGSYWDGYKSNENPQTTQAYGSCSALPATVSPSQFKAPCISTSRFNMANSNGATKIWSAEGGTNAVFQLTANGAPVCSAGGPTAHVGCAVVNGLIYNSFLNFLVAPPHPNASSVGNNGGFCFPNGTANGATSGDTVCGTAVFTLKCSSTTLINAVVEGSATSKAGNDDSFYSILDGNVSGAYTVHARYSVGTWSNSRPIFPNPVTLSAGTHTITLAEREDGTRMRQITLTQGAATCYFAQPHSSGQGITGAGAGGSGGHLLVLIVASVGAVLGAGIFLGFYMTYGRKSGRAAFRPLENQDKYELDRVAQADGDDDDDDMLDMM